VASVADHVIASLILSDRHKHLFMPAQPQVKLAGMLPWDISCKSSLSCFYVYFLQLTLICSLPPSSEGEWWELSDNSRDGIPYYYQTKTGETVWERPKGFVIPLGIVQVCV